MPDDNRTGLVLILSLFAILVICVVAKAIQ